jgi:hypothetical protein
MGRPGFDSRKGQDFSRLHSVLIGSGAHPASYTMRTGGFAPGDKAVRGVKLTTHLHLVPRSRLVELYLHSPTRFHVVVLIKHRNNFMCYLEYARRVCGPIRGRGGRTCPRPDHSGVRRSVRVIEVSRYFRRVRGQVFTARSVK